MGEQGWIQDFFVGGGAPLRNGVTHSFFFCRIPVVLETAGHLRGGGGAHPLHPPPRAAPGEYMLKEILHMLMKIIVQT